MSNNYSCSVLKICFLIYNSMTEFCVKRIMLMFKHLHPSYIVTIMKEGKFVNWPILKLNREKFVIIINHKTKHANCNSFSIVKAYSNQVFCSLRQMRNSQNANMRASRKMSVQEHWEWSQFALETKGKLHENVVFRSSNFQKFWKRRQLRKQSPD